MNVKGANVIQHDFTQYYNTSSNQETKTGKIGALSESIQGPIPVGAD